MDWALSKSQRLLLGLIVLILVDVILVSSSKLSKYVWKHDDYKKPFFSTYIKSSMFIFYLLGFLVWPPWKDTHCRKAPENYVHIVSDDEAYLDEPINASLSNPVYVPVKIESREHLDKSSGTESSGEEPSTLRSVRFNKVAEVRHLSEVEAADALLARLSYQAYLRRNVSEKRSIGESPTAYQMSKLAVTFCLLWFSSNYTFTAASFQADSALVNTFYSTTCMWVFVLASFYPSEIGDRFSLTKLLAVSLSLAGIVLIFWPSDCKIQKRMVPFAAVLPVISSIFNAMYVVLLKRNVQNEGNVDIPMFFGFVGLFNLLLLWPVLMTLHVLKIETFELPTKNQFIFIVLNGFLVTVLAQALWLWGCLLTSSLMGTISVTMTIPLNLMADAIMDHQNPHLVFYIGLFLMMGAFIVVTAFTYFENLDPLYRFLRVFYEKCHCRKATAIYSDLNDSAEQRQSLMESNSESD